jgi:16S rRNA processing protein RimM
MIQREDLVKIGQFKKPHGILGEIAFSFSSDSFDKCERPFFFCELDGLFVPFLLEEYRFNSASTAFVKLKSVDSELKARSLSGKDVYFPKDYLSRDTFNASSIAWDYFIGFTLIDKQTGKIGRISDVNESTINTLFVVEQGENEILIPATGEWIVAIDKKKKTLRVELPEGLLN